MRKGHPREGGAFTEVLSGDVLLSHSLPVAVPSALRGLTSGFGMGPGVSLSLWPPKLYGVLIRQASHTRPNSVGGCVICVPDHYSGATQWTRNIFEIGRASCRERVCQ